MKHWVRADVVKALVESNPFDVKVELIDEVRGDYDLHSIELHLDGEDEYVRVIPYIDPEDAPFDDCEVDDADVLGVVVDTSASDSRGGILTSSDKIGMLYGLCCARLSRLGFAVYTNHDEMF